MIRVWIETASFVTRAGLESLLESSGLIQIVNSPSHADVALLDETPDSPGSAPTVLLSDEPFNSPMLHLGVQAILPSEAPAEQIIAALYAVSAGLIAVPTESISLIVPAASESVVETLTPREMEALEMLAEGLSNKQIAARLGISEHTAKFHVNSILGKFDAATRTEAVMRGIRTGLLKV